MALVVRQEHDISYDATATMAAEGFGVAAGSFDPARLRWLYERAFSNGTTVLSLYAEDRKVGQVALLHQSVCVDGQLETAIALVDLFILKDFRSREAMADLYGEVERFCRDTPIRFILAVPNPKGAKVNIRYLRLADFLRLEIRGGVCRPWRGRGVAVSTSLERLGSSKALDLFGRFLPSEASGLFWTPETLWERLQNRAATYAVHATDSLMLISSPRTSRRLPHVLLCAMLPKPGTSVAAQDVRRLARAACAVHRRPIFVYAGINHDVPLPGVVLPDRFRPSPMVVQMRDFSGSEKPVHFSRFELLDFDFA